MGDDDDTSAEELEAHLDEARSRVYRGDVLGGVAEMIAIARTLQRLGLRARARDVAAEAATAEVPDAPAETRERLRELTDQADALVAALAGPPATIRQT